MAGSKIPGPTSTPWAPAPKNPGPFGSNGDGGDPETPRWFVGDTPGPLGVNDYADPDSPMRSLMCRSGSNHGWLVMGSQSSQRKSAPATSAPGIRRADTQPSARNLPAVTEAEQRLKKLNDDEKALRTEIDKVGKDLDAWNDVRKWFDVESRSRIVTLKESNDKFNMVRWSGQGKKVGGINTTAGGEVVLDQTFEKNNPAVIVDGYRRHEEVHKKDYNNIGSFEAGWGYIWNGESWATDRHITSELDAHRTQKEFYEDCLRKIPAQKAEVERQLKDLRAKGTGAAR